MTDVSAIATETTPPGRSLPARVVGVVFSPRATYADVAARPRPFGVLLLVLLLCAGGVFAFLSTEVGQNAMLDQQIRTMESFGMKITDQQYERMEQGLERAPYFGSIGQIVTLSLAAVVISGLAIAVFNAFLGGDATFKQVFAIVAHSSVIIALSQLFTLPIGYARESMSGATNLGVFVQFLDESSFLARALGAIDLFIIWWLVSLAIGLGVLYRKRTAPIATTLIAIYVALGVVLAIVKSVVSGA